MIYNNVIIITTALAIFSFSGNSTKAASGPTPDDPWICQCNSGCTFIVKDVWTCPQLCQYVTPKGVKCTGQKCGCPESMPKASKE